MKNNRGALTIDYMFAFMLVSGFTLVIITLTSTLSVVELTQYITFAAARSYFAGHISEPEQKKLAQRKFNELRTNPIVAPLYSGGWFQMPDDSIVIDYDIPKKYPQFQGYSEQNTGTSDRLFHGVVVFFSAKILEFQIPFFGNTKKDSGASANGFNTYIGSYVGREPTFDECNSFNQKRWKAIRALPVQAGAPYSQAGSEQSYVVINDNGC